MKPKTKLLWINALSCNGDAHSFLNYPFLERFLENFEFIYHPVIDSDYSLEDIATKDIDCDILLIDGTINDSLEKAGVPIVDIIEKYGQKADKILTIGTCASFGGIFLQSCKEGYGFQFKNENRYNKFQHFRKKTINISGCPIHPKILVNTLHQIRNGMDIKLDEMLRPKEFYAYTVHNGCIRNEYFEYKIDNHKFGNLEGCMFYDHGCQAPFTHGSCNKILWNEINSKTAAGHPCLGCTEPTFPRENLFVTKKNMGIPEKLPLGIAKRTYLTFAGIAKAFKINRLEKKLFDD